MSLRERAALVSWGDEPPLPAGAMDRTVPTGVRFASRRLCGSCGSRIQVVNQCAGEAPQLSDRVLVSGVGHASGESAWLGGGVIAGSMDGRTSLR